MGKKIAEIMSIAQILNKVEIDLAQLIKLELTADEYVFLYCWYHKLVQPRLKVHIGELEQKDYLKVMPGSYINLRQKAIDLFEHRDIEKSWIEFFLEFPMKVPGRNGASRPLRPGSLDAKQSAVIKQKYLKVINDKPELHNTIMQVLSAEIEMRKQSSTMQFMHNIETWINKRDWEVYAYLLDEKIEKNKEKEMIKHGEKLI